MAWEGTWIRHRLIPEDKRECHTKTSWFNDGVQMAVREWYAGAGESKFFFFLDASSFTSIL